MTNTDTTLSGSRSMTEPSEAAKAKAQRMIADTPEGMLWSTTAEYALARFIQQVSDAAKRAIERTNSCHRINMEVELEPFILSAPIDPLEEALRSFCPNDAALYPQPDDSLRAALAKQGLKIVKGET